MARRFVAAGGNGPTPFMGPWLVVLSVVVVVVVSFSVVVMSSLTLVVFDVVSTFAFRLTSRSKTSIRLALPTVTLTPTYAICSTVSVNVVVVVVVIAKSNSLVILAIINTNLDMIAPTKSARISPAFTPCSNDLQNLSTTCGVNACGFDNMYFELYMRRTSMIVS